jgi:hypothetical protein
VVAFGGAWCPTFIPPLYTMTTHQPGDTVDTDPSAFGTQGGMHARAAVDCAIICMDTTDVSLEAAIGHNTSAVRAVPPCIVATN